MQLNLTNGSISEFLTTAQPLHVQRNLPINGSTLLQKGNTLGMNVSIIHETLPHHNSSSLTTLSSSKKHVPSHNLIKREISPFIDLERQKPFSLDGFIDLISKNSRQLIENLELQDLTQNFDPDAPYNLAIQLDETPFDGYKNDMPYSYKLTQLALMMTAKIRGSKPAQNWINQKKTSFLNSSENSQRFKHQELLSAAYELIDNSNLEQLRDYIAHGLKQNIGHSYTLGALLTYSEYLRNPGTNTIKHITRNIMRRKNKIANEGILTSKEVEILLRVLKKGFDKKMVIDCDTRAYEGEHPFSQKTIRIAKANEKKVSLDNLQSTLQDIFTTTMNGKGSFFRSINNPGYHRSIALLKSKLKLMSILYTEERFTVKADNYAGEAFKSSNLHAIIPGTTNKVISVGAHLDSVPLGPGINDNASGVATILEVLRIINSSTERPKNTVLFSFWGGEEFGLLGSRYFMRKGNPNKVFNILRRKHSDNGLLISKDQFKIISHVNFDMTASPNGKHLITGLKIKDERKNIFTGKSMKIDAPENSIELEYLFVNYFQERKLNSTKMPLLDHSDHAAFAFKKVPTVMLSTGVSEKTITGKNKEDGTRGEIFDPCYHQLCDNLDNINQTLHLEQTKAATFVVTQLAMSDDIFGKIKQDPQLAFEPSCMNET